MLHLARHESRCRSCSESRSHVHARAARVLSAARRPRSAVPCHRARAPHSRCAATEPVQLADAERLDALYWAWTTEFLEMPTDLAAPAPEALGLDVAAAAAWLEDLRRTSNRQAIENEAATQLETGWLEPHPPAHHHRLRVFLQPAAGAGGLYRAVGRSAMSTSPCSSFARESESLVG